MSTITNGTLDAKEPDGPDRGQVGPASKST